MLFKSFDNPSDDTMSQADKLSAFMNKVALATKDDLSIGETVDGLLRNTMEELGEYAAALTIESGRKNKNLKESSQQEAIDVIICALSLFYASGGKNKTLVEYGAKKLDKWRKRIDDSNRIK